MLAFRADSSKRSTSAPLQPDARKWAVRSAYASPQIGHLRAGTVSGPEAQHGARINYEDRAPLAVPNGAVAGDYG